MIYKIQFESLSAMLVDLVNENNGLLYLRIVGNETSVNAIWARLSAKAYRENPYSSKVEVAKPGQSHPTYIALSKAHYRTLRTRLPSGMVDLALIHPNLTVAEDNENGFYLLSYDQGIPAGFFDRLNASLSIPLKPEWEPWLWEQGQQPQTGQRMVKTTVWEHGSKVEKDQLKTTTELPIYRKASLGQVACYKVHCNDRYKDAWLDIIREQLGLGIQLEADNQGNYLNGRWAAHSQGETWKLFNDDELVFDAPDLEHLVAQAHKIGVPLIIKEN